MSSHALDGPIGIDELVHRPSWQAFANCRDEPIETFFPGRGASTKRARELCAGCVVRAECLDTAMADVDLEGFWGGTSAKERGQLRRQAS
jgi:WhiB family redox-sensing transcriptional regulator